MIKSVNAKVYLNVYDISDVNVVTHFVGFGTYHSGIEFYNQEYTFSEQGMFSHSPKKASNGTFRQQILLGEDMSKLTTKLKNQGFLGRNYDVLKMNCNHYAEALARLLLSKDAQVTPQWIHRSASVGNYFSSWFKKDDSSK